MSETVHYIGFATKIMQPHGKTVMDVAKSILKEKGYEINEYFKEDAILCLTEDFDSEFFFYPKTQSLYKITRVEHEPDEDIIEAKLIGFDDSQIAYELRYYNGGAVFEECLEEAFDKLNL
jgi:hypothetical protein